MSALPTTAVRHRSKEGRMPAVIWRRRMPLARSSARPTHTYNMLSSVAIAFAFLAYFGALFLQSLLIYVEGATIPLKCRGDLARARSSWEPVGY